MDNLDVQEGIRLVRLLRRHLPANELAAIAKALADWKPPTNPENLRYLDQDKRFHPLAFLLKHADETIRAWGRDKQTPVSEALVRAAVLGRAVETLAKRGTPGLESRLASLVGPDFDNFEKTVYEIEVAAHYTRRGSKVRFVPTSAVPGIRTPDIEADGAQAIEVECKKMDRESQAEAKHGNVWDTLMGDFASANAGLSDNFNVALTTDHLLIPSEREAIKRGVAEAMRTGQTGVVSLARGCTAVLTKGPPAGKEIPATGLAGPTGDDRTSGSISASVRIDPVRGPLWMNPRHYSVFCPLVPNRVEAVKDLIRKGSTQLSGEKPGVLFVAVTPLAKPSSRDQLGDLAKQVEDLLTRRPNVSACILTMDAFHQDPQGITYRHLSRAIVNPKAAHPVDSAMLPPNA